MHSFGYRVNALLTLGVTVLALMCAMASFSDNFNCPSPSADVQVMNVNWFQKQRTGDDEVSLTLKISANLQSSFTWNTKQVFAFLAAEYETPDNALNQKGRNSYVVTGEANFDETGKHLPEQLDECPVTRECLSFKIAALLKYASRISLWDSIIPSKERAKFTIHTKNKYRLIDQGSNLRGKDFNLTLHWHVMPKTGKMFADKILMTGYHLPKDYR